MKTNRAIIVIFDDQTFVVGCTTFELSGKEGESHE